MNRLSMCILLATAAVLVASELGSGDVRAVYVQPYVYEDEPDDLEDFLAQLAFWESSGVSDTVSASGMLGKYQFSPTTLRHLGYTGTFEAFLADDALQDQYVLLLLEQNRDALARTIRRLEGSQVHGVRITKSGLLAGAHLVGVGGVLAFLYPDRYSFPTSDGNGVPVSRYIHHFSGFQFEL